MLEADLVRRRSPRHGPLRLIGIVLLMLASGVFGYAGWLLWGTGIKTAQAQVQLRSSLHEDDRRPTQAVLPPLPGQAYAELHIPKIGLDVIVVQGTDTNSLKEGPGHYSGTSNPWDATGRVGIAGHRTTYLHPFFNLDRVSVGDLITLRTAHGTYVYKVSKVFVIPADGSGYVLNPTTKPTLVLTTCAPRYAATHRLIVTADRIG